MATKAKSTKGGSRKAPSRKTPKTGAERGVIDNIWGVILIAVGVFLFFAVKFNAAGQLGNVIGGFLKGVFGILGIAFPFYLIIFGLLLLFKKTVHISGFTVALAAVVFLMLCIFNAGLKLDGGPVPFELKRFYSDGTELSGAGFFGMLFGNLLVKYVGRVGLFAISTVVITICILLIINTPVSRAIEAIRQKRIDRAAMNELKRQDELARYEQAVRQKEKDRAREIKEQERILKEQRRLDDMKCRDKAASVPVADVSPELGLPSLFGSRAHAAKPAPEKTKHFVEMITDDSLFEKDDGERVRPAYESRGYGLEEPSVRISGYGLDGDDPELKDGIHDLISASVESSEKTLFTDRVREEAAAEVKTADRLSNREAGQASLDASDFSKVKKAAGYKKPPLDLLKNVPKNNSDGRHKSMLNEKASILENTLRSFNVDAKVIQVTQGPAVTRYEIQPNVGVKVNKIVNLADDIALNLRARSIRIEAPIPGKAAVGIEVENEHVNMVTLREVIASREFKEAKSRLTFAVGRDIAGKSIVNDLKYMPHLLIAGSTGSGKSVCINSIIMSIMYKADPDEVKLVLIDPKVVELGNYNGIPHLLIPVVTEPAKAAAALNWAVAEMTDRYRKFADAQVRDLASYNDRMKASGEAENVMSQIVIIIDELADLMMAAPSQVEESICRLAQMARAAGMHLIVATQRPSVDIITGLIKANIPSRIAFAVSSQFDSRTILDMGGAEKLVGKGDMLFAPLGTGKPVRVQGCFVSDEEVNSVIEFVKAQIEDPGYAGEVIDTIERGGVDTQSSAHDDPQDELMPEAVECVVQAGQCSVSMLQRRFRIGYNRAARIVDEMEARGIVGPQDGSRPRQVLMTEDELVSLKGDTPDEQSEE